MYACRCVCVRARGICIIFGKTRGTIPASALHLPCVVRATAAVLACYAVDMRGARWALAVHGVVAITAAGHIGALADRLAACRGAPSAVPVCSAVIMLLTLWGATA